jgi:hypothetical protein
MKKASLIKNNGNKRLPKCNQHAYRSNLANSHRIEGKRQELVILDEEREESAKLEDDPMNLSSRASPHEIEMAAGPAFDDRQLTVSIDFGSQ